MADKAGFHRMIVILLAGITLPTMAASEIDPPLSPYVTQSQIQGIALSNTRGVVGVNLSAGDSNDQINVRALSLSTGPGVSSARNQTQQHVHLISESPNSTISKIEGKAFSNSRGLISVNLVSGAGNAQTNAIAISLSTNGVAVSENELSMSVSGQPVTVDDSLTSSHSRETSISADAFVDAKGVLQINQLAGSGNATSNSFGLSVSLGSTP